jgi:hypothetical protein
MEKQAGRPWTELEFLEVVDIPQELSASQTGLCSVEVGPKCMLILSVAKSVSEKSVLVGYNAALL